MGARIGVALHFDDVAELRIGARPVLGRVEVAAAKQRHPPPVRVADVQCEVELVRQAEVPSDAQRPQIGVGVVEVHRLVLVAQEHVEEIEQAQRGQGAAAERATQHLAVQLARPVVKLHAQAVGDHFRALLATRAAAELAQPAGRRAPHRAHRHDGRANRDQGEAEAAGEQKAGAGQHAERCDERPHALREVRRIGLDEAARRQ